LPDNWVQTISIDEKGNKWIGTWGGGLAIYREGGVIVGVKEITGEIPRKFSLYQNYPNPFNLMTTIEFDIPERANVRLIVYDILGREIEKLLDKELEVGRYRVNFDAKGLPSGIYFYRLEVGGQVEVKKMVLVK
jgi:hypothetical protein